MTTITAAPIGANVRIQYKDNPDNIQLVYYSFDMEPIAAMPHYELKPPEFDKFGVADERIYFYVDGEEDCKPHNEYDYDGRRILGYELVYDLNGVLRT